MPAPLLAQSVGQNPWDTPLRAQPSPELAGSSTPAIPERGAVPRDGGCRKPRGQCCALLHLCHGFPPAQQSAGGSSAGSPEASPSPGLHRNPATSPPRDGAVGLTCSAQGSGWTPACARRTTRPGALSLSPGRGCPVYSRQISTGTLQTHSSLGWWQGTGCFEAGSFPGKEQALIATRPLGSKTLMLLCSAAAAPAKRAHAQPRPSLPPQGTGRGGSPHCGVLSPPAAPHTGCRRALQLSASQQGCRTPQTWFGAP